ncbi:MAG: hypothetical protein JNL33_14975 [Betaproteobacteria bacterium]|nr:hypothetical protein [Betaproteobacteria bacterium]
MKQLAHQTSGAARRASPVSHSGNPDRSIEWLHRVLRTQAAISWSVVVGSAAVVMLSDRLKDGPGTAIVALSGVAAFLYYGWRSRTAWETFESIMAGATEKARLAEMKERPEPGWPPERPAAE